MNPVTQLWDQILDSLWVALDALMGGFEDGEHWIWRQMDQMGIPSAIQPYLMMVLVALLFIVAMRMMNGTFRLLTAALLLLFLFHLIRPIFSA